MAQGLISKDQFEKSQDINLKLNILFETEVVHHKEMNGRMGTLEERVVELSKSVNTWKKVHTVTAAAAGAVAGFFGGLLK